MRARTVNGMLAFWLFLSTFMWTHARFQLENNWLVAVAVMFLAMAGISGVARARFAAAGLGAWLAAVSLMTMMTSTVQLTAIHDLVVGIGIACFGLLRDIGRPDSYAELEPGPSTIGYTAGDDIELRHRPA